MAKGICRSSCSDKIHNILKKYEGQLSSDLETEVAFGSDNSGSLGEVIVSENDTDEDFQ
jgi:hypothetical protein